MQDYNDADITFVQSMIAHHTDALDMSERYIEEGSDPKVIAWARAIMKGQSQEIRTWRDWLAVRGLDEQQSIEDM